MPLETYLVNQFDTTHENEFFRSFHERLKTSLQNIKSRCILIGNLSCQGHSLDALFIQDGKVIILEFKNYSGRLEFNENNPWKIYNNENDFVFISGSNRIRNPYNQVKVYRNALSDFLVQKNSEILEPNRVNINWRHS